MTHDRNSDGTPNGVQAKPSWGKPTIADSTVEAITQTNPFNGTPTPHDSNAFLYS